MRTYDKFSPTSADVSGLGLEDRQHWLVAPCGRTRDSNVLEESNFAALLALLGDEGDTVEIHRFGHWGLGWFEIILIDPGDELAVAAAQDAEERLEDYPVLDEDDNCEREMVEAARVWADCYSTEERLAYIRRYESQFEWRDWADLIGCVRGEHFSGYANELLYR